MVRVGILTCPADTGAAAKVCAALTFEGANCLSNLDLGRAENLGLAEAEALREVFSSETTICFVLLSKSFLAHTNIYKLYDDFVIRGRARPRFLVGAVIDDTQDFPPPYSGIRSLDFFRYGLQTIVARFQQLPDVRQEIQQNKVNIDRIKKALADVRNNFIIEDITKPEELALYFLIRATDKIEVAESLYYIIARFPQASISLITSTFQSSRQEIPKTKLRVILPKPRRGTLNPEATLRSFSDGFQITPDRVSYLNSFFGRLSEVVDTRTSDYFDPLFVPVSGIIDEARLSPITDVLDYLVKWTTLDDHDPLLVITAPGGYGKTTLIRKLHDSLLAQKKHVIYLDANEFVDHFRRANVAIARSTLFEILRSSGDAFSFKENEFYLGWSLNNFVVIIDGLDEILSRLTIDLNVSHFLKDIVENNEDGGGKIILTAREIFWDQTRDVDARRLYLQPFDEFQAQSMFEKYFSASIESNDDFAAVAQYVRVCMQDADAIAATFAVVYPLSDIEKNYYVPFVLEYIANEHFYVWKSNKWPAPGSEDTELGVLMEPEVCHGATEVYARVQA